jgi:hypothetical protein
MKDFALGTNWIERGCCLAKVDVSEDGTIVGVANDRTVWY